MVLILKRLCGSLAHLMDSRLKITSKFAHIFHIIHVCKLLQIVTYAHLK